RMGTLFAYEQYGVEPDIMTLAKGLGSGVPIGAFLAKERVSVFTPGEHGSTFGGSPLICAASLASLKFIIENDVPSQVKRVGQYFVNGLGKLKAQFDFISEIRGGGLLLALGFTKDIAAEIVLECLKEGLLVNPVKPNAIRFMPPLIITEKEVDEALDILKTVFNRRSKNGK
ncbi:MAG: aminotransferase class III-fold pyridoxal phosphate-dependent enzyme, partial [Chloroflexi bacterium]|nr:aminotransferase class III-fold pyridoxal phosphate-dependent enzyme [Chloroflexota bacterium]